jgi:Flp pilus assembly pilin Flp
MSGQGIDHAEAGIDDQVPCPSRAAKVGQEVIRLSFSSAWELFKTVRKRQEGQTMTEYAIVLSLVAVVVIAAVTALGSRISTVITGITGRF